MLINDLSYLEDIPAANSIVGSTAMVGVEANALATGDSAYTLANTTAKFRELGNGGSIAMGRGTAVAIGDDPMAEIIAYGEGDKVIEKTRTRYFKNKNTEVARGFVIAIDQP